MDTPLLRATPASFLLLAVVSCTQAPQPGPEPSDASATTTVDLAPIIEPITFDPATRPYELAGPLVPANTSMISAWDIPKHPLTDPSLDDSAESELVRKGFRLFMATPTETPRLTPSRLACGNCHLNAGQRELALT